MKAPVFNGVFDIVKKVMKDPVKGVFRAQDGSAVVRIDYLFLDNHQEVDDDGVPYGAPRPIAVIQQGIIDPVYGDFFKVEGTEYLIREVEPADSQYIKLILQDDRR